MRRWQPRSSSLLETTRHAEAKLWTKSDGSGLQLARKVVLHDVEAMEQEGQALKDPGDVIGRRYGDDLSSPPGIVSLTAQISVLVDRNRLENHSVNNNRRGARHFSCHVPHNVRYPKALVSFRWTSEFI